MPQELTGDDNGDGFGACGGHVGHVTCEVSGVCLDDVVQDECVIDDVYSIVTVSAHQHVELIVQPSSPNT